jgi:hypothetical protein
MGFGVWGSVCDTRFTLVSQIVKWQVVTSPRRIARRRARHAPAQRRHVRRGRARWRLRWARAASRSDSREFCRGRGCSRRSPPPTHHRHHHSPRRQGPPLLRSLPSAAAGWVVRTPRPSTPPSVPLVGGRQHGAGCCCAADAPPDPHAAGTQPGRAALRVLPSKARADGRPLREFRRVLRAFPQNSRVRSNLIHVHTKPAPAKPAQSAFS